MSDLWDKNNDKDFFVKSLQLTSLEKLFYKTEEGEYYAYWPNEYKGIKNTLQSRNSFIGHYTENWTKNLFNEIAMSVGGYSVPNVISNEIGLTKKSPADIAICKTNEQTQKPEDILMIIEVKMSVVWNWEYIQKRGTKFDVVCIGDYKTHKGNPGLLRSDSMLKAIGKSAVIRVSSFASSKIPIIIVGNTPITKHYKGKVDTLKRNGIIQGFWSLNPNPADDNGECIKITPLEGFYTFNNLETLKQSTLKLIKGDKNFFSSWQNRKQLGKFIEIANRETSYEMKACRFLKLLHQNER
jgi:hypothetical protein